jgi:Uma2 family endonuclease
VTSAAAGVHELIDGRILPLPPNGPAERAVIGRLVGLLAGTLPPSQMVVTGEIWACGTDRYVPDAMVIPAENTRSPFAGVPALVVEVLGGDRARDLVVKQQRYARTGLRSLWLVDPVQGWLAAADFGDPRDASATDLDEDTPSVRVDVGGTPVTLQRAALFGAEFSPGA